MRGDSWNLQHAPTEVIGGACGRPETVTIVTLGAVSVTVTGGIVEIAVMVSVSVMNTKGSSV